MQSYILMKLNQNRFAELRPALIVTPSPVTAKASKLRLRLRSRNQITSRAQNLSLISYNMVTQRNLLKNLKDFSLALFIIMPTAFLKFARH